MTEDNNIIETPSELAFEYKLIRLLGEGSYGKTYLARDLHRGDLVAIKALKNVKDYKSLELFRREAAVLESLRVVGVPRFYQSIIPDNPLADSSYIIQEYVDYPSIQSIMAEKGKFSEGETLQVLNNLSDILCILQSSYEPPVIHRDIKPSNILAQIETNEYARVFLIDFGSVSNPQKRTGGSTIAGTLGYMAPEQLMGECTIQSDFYSLGATALHMLTGVAPYMMESKGFELDFLSAIQKYAPETSENMQKLLVWLLEPKAGNRPSSARELQRAIIQVMLGCDPKAKPDNALSKSPVMPTAIDAAKWVECEGMVWCINMVRDDLGMGEDAYEYTFEANGRHWMGQTLMRYVYSMSTTLQSGYYNDTLPCKCKVKYDPQNPLLNCMITIYRKK